MDKPLETKTPPLEYKLFLLQLEWNLFWPPQLPQLPVHKDSVPQSNILWNVSFYKPSQDELTKQMQPFGHPELSVEQLQLLAQQHGIVEAHPKQRPVCPQDAQFQTEHKTLQQIRQGSHRL